MNDLYSITTDVKEATKIIMENMVATRTRGEIKYRPYRISDAITHSDYLGWENADLKKIHPDVNVGDRIYIGMNLVSSAACRAGLSVKGNVKVFLEGKEIQHSPEVSRSDSKGYYVDVKKGDNDLGLLCECDNEKDFTVSFIPSTVQYMRMWAKDYLLYLGVFSPLKEFSKEEGIGVSKVYRKDEEFPKTKDIQYVWPVIENVVPELDMDKIFQNEKGQTAYALTYALQDSMVKLHCTGRMQMLINGYMEECSGSAEVRKGDIILLKFIRENGCFGRLEYEADAHIGIPFMESNRSVGDKWLTLGTFGRENESSLALGPEQGIWFDKPYTDYEWKQVFWNLSTKDDCLRPYMDTFFFSQWFYAIMVGHYGILQAAKLMQSKEYLNFFIDSIGNMTRFFEYANYEKQHFNNPTFIGRSAQLSCLDNIGTMGMNIAELYRLTGDKDALYVLSKLSEAVKKNISRFEDGTVYRQKEGNTMWADDFYMCCPMLARLGLIFRDNSYFEDCVTQIRGFKKRLYRPDKNLFSHIYFVSEDKPNQVSWSRGNGWIFSGLADIADKIPDGVEGKEEVIKTYVEFADSLLKYQDEDGLWHQVIDCPESYQETSGTTMFLWGMCRGINNGLLDKNKYIDCVRKAYKGLLKYKIDAQGNVYGVCRGSGLSMDAEYYKQLGALTNDDHGTGLILAAFEEYSRVVGNDENE